MKKTLLTIAVVAVAVSAKAQASYNYFDASDVDADGWLWFDTQEKLDKYCGWGSDYKIQLQTATFEDADGQFAEPELDATVPGYNADGQQGGDGAKTGAIILPAAASVSDSPNGGSIMMWLPDCAEISMFISTEYDKICTGVKGAKGWVEPIDCATIKTYLSMSWGAIQPLAKVSQYQWNNIQNLTNADGLQLKSSAGNKVTGQIVNNMKYPLYVHGIKVLTYTASAGVESAVTDATAMKLMFDGSRVVASQDADIEVYTAGGRLVARGVNAVAVENLTAGVYVAKATGAGGTATIKIAK